MLQQRITATRGARNHAREQDEKAIEAAH